MLYVYTNFIRLLGEDHTVHISRSSPEYVTKVYLGFVQEQFENAEKNQVIVLQMVNFVHSKWNSPIITFALSSDKK